MKKLILVIASMIFFLTANSQGLFPKGIKVGKIKTGTNVITVDSITQSSTNIIRFWKGSVSMIPFGTGAGNGTVTAVHAGIGLLGGTITMSGTIDADTTVMQTKATATPKTHIGSGGSSHAQASTSQDGFESAADKTKLDGIANNAINLALAVDTFQRKKDSIQAKTVVVMKADSSTTSKAGGYPSSKMFADNIALKVNVTDSTTKFITPTQLNAIKNPDWLQVLQDAGSTVKAVPIFFSLNSAYNSITLTSGLAVWMMVDVKVTTSFTGIEFMPGGTPGAFTGNNENKVALYKLNGSTQNKVAESANDATIWKSATSVMKQVAFTSPYTASPGIYYIAFVFSSSATTTAPTLWAQGAMCDDLIGTICGNNKICFYIASTTSLASSQANSVGTKYGSCPYFFLY